MRKQAVTGLIAGAGFILGSVNAGASGFGGGWSHDSTGTLHNSNAPSYDSTTAQKMQPRGAGFGGGWFHDKTTGTLYNASAPSPEKKSPSRHKEQVASSASSFGGGWMHDSTGTLTYVD